MSDEQDPSTVERRTKQLFDASAAALDAATRSRLTQARHRALAELVDKPSAAWRWAFVPAGAVGAAALAVWLVWQPVLTPDTGLAAEQLGDLEILLAEEDLEMLDEDLDFYGWLEEQPEFAASGDGVG